MTLEEIVTRFITDPYNLRMGAAKLASRFKTDKETIYLAKERVRQLLKADKKAETANYISDLESEVTKEVNNDKGTLKSTMECDFDPKDDIELAALHKVDLTKYKISNYWSKLKSSGKFTSSILCTLRKLGDSVEASEIKDSLQTILSSVKPFVNRIDKDVSEKALIVFFADEHVGAAVTDSLYPNEYNTSVYYQRKSTVLDVIKEQKKLHGKFDTLIVVSLGDTLDGFNQQTTRGGHHIPQNMTNKQAITAYLEVNKFIWDDIISLDAANHYEKYDIENSNHGGLGWDYAANLTLNTYLSAKYPFIKINGIEDFIGSFSYGVHDFHICHGKDEKYQRRNLPLHLNAQTEIFIKEYVEDRGYGYEGRPQHFFKGDLHKFTVEEGKFFTYYNAPSLFGGSAWVSVNFGKSKPGYIYGVLKKNDKNFNVIPYWFDGPQ